MNSGRKSMGPGWAVAARMLLLAGVLAAMSSRGAAADPAAPVENVSVVSIGDIRQGGSQGRLEIGIEVSDVRAAEVDAMRITVTAALDDTGRDLLPRETKEIPFEQVHGGYASDTGEEPIPLVVTATLRNPARRAKVLADFSGEIEVYRPVRDPAAVAAIPEIASWAGRAIEHPALAAAQVGIAVLTAEQLAAEMKRQAEGRRAEARQHGILGEMMESVASAFLKAFFTPGPGDLVLAIDDPGKRLVRLTLLDAEGADQTGGQGRQRNFTILSSASGGPGPGWSLLVHLATAKAVERRPFALKNVRLP